MSNFKKVKTNSETGIVWVPWATKTQATKINNTTVWHSNKFINFLIKIRNLIYTPKDLKNFEKYCCNKKVDSQKFGVTRVKNN